MVFEPLTAVTVPLQVPPMLGATTRPVGKVSVKLRPVSANDGLGLLIVKVKLVVLPKAMVGAPNVLLMIGGAATVKLAVAVALITLLSPPLLMLLGLTPDVVPVMLMLLGAATTNPRGGASVKDPPVVIASVNLLRLKVSVLMPFVGIVAAPALLK
jgi:hypothetical protein